MLDELCDFVENIWDDINPVTVEEAFSQQNLEARRTYFDSIGVINLFKSLDPKLLDRQEVVKTRQRWDENNEQYQVEYKDLYELYKIDGKKLFPEEANKTGEDRPIPVYAVRCWCTTTNREYWIYSFRSRYK